MFTLTRINKSDMKSTATSAPPVSSVSGVFGDKLCIRNNKHRFQALFRTDTVLINEHPDEKLRGEVTGEHMHAHV